MTTTENMRRPLVAFLLLLTATLTTLTALTSPAGADTRSQPAADPVLEPSTLHCLGVYWIIKGDDNKNATVGVEYRRAGEPAWRRGADLFRVEKGAQLDEKGKGDLAVPEDGWLFAGSIVLLEPDTAYELRLKLADPDGPDRGQVEKVLQARTAGEPLMPNPLRQLHVVPGSGGGTGTKDDPFRGLDAAQKQARPGDLFLLHAGVYPGPFTASACGEAGRPIIWRGAGDGETIIDSKPAGGGKRAGRGISAGDIHDVWFERLTIRNADYGIVGHRSYRLVVRRCHIHDCDFGLTCTNNDNGKVADFFIADNTIEGPCTWPRTKGIEDPRGVQVTGSGHVVCYNRIRGFSDAMDTFPSRRCSAIDFHNNEVSEMTDDGCEMDYSFRNTRCFHNRFTNVFQGISVQPVYGGPVYVFRNVLDNVVQEPFKMHNSPSGALFLHNTCVKKGMPLLLMTDEKVRHCIMRNNLFIGTDGNYAYESTAPMADCDFDYDGFGGGPWGNWMKWNGVRYKTLAEVQARAPVYRHAVLVDPATAFASGLRAPDDPNKPADPAGNDPRLTAKSAAVDAGQELPGFNDGFKGKAPDLGAIELGERLPHYGPRPEN